MDKFVKSQISQLEELVQKHTTAKTTQATKKRVEQIIQLYAQRKIAKIATAETMIKGSLSTDKKVYEKAFTKLKDNIDKWKGSETLSARLNEKKKKKEKKTFFVEFVLYQYVKGNLKELGIKSRKAFTHQGVHCITVSFDDQTATIKATEFLKVDKNERIFRWENADDIGDPDKQNSRCWQVINLLKDDEDFRQQIDTLTAYYDNLGSIKIKTVEQETSNGERMNILNENLTDVCTDATNVDTYHYYINTLLRIDADTFKKGIEKGHYIENVCWRNVLIDFYGNTLMSEKKRNRLTIERISEIIGKDDFTEKGVSIKEM